MKNLDKQTILDQTDGGLEIIKRLYPESEKNGRFPHFQLDSRSENTPSVNVYKPAGAQQYLVKDHGSGENYNALDLIMEKYGYDFAQACKWAASEFNVDGGSIAFNSPTLEFLDATEDQQDGEMYFEYNEQLTEYELKVLGQMVSNEVCKKYKVKSCKSFTQIKQYKGHEKFGDSLKQIITKSNETYPIFVIDEGSWQKIYQPLNKDKGFRFRYSGSKPKDHVFGLEQLREDWEQLIEDEQELDEIERIGKLDRVVIAGGDRDALNVASLNVPVIWLNSETAVLDFATYHELKKMCREICYIGDIDDTGVKETVKLALQYIDINIVWLPEKLKQYSYRGKHKKDFKDFVDHYYNKGKKDFYEHDFKNNILANALPAKFWDTIYQKGKGIKYAFNNEAFYRFLKYNGFYKIEEEEKKEDYSFVRIQDNIVERVAPHHLAEFPTNFLLEKNESVDLVNFIHRTSQLGERSLSRIAKAEIEFKDHGEDFQYYFFKNKVWKITPEGTTELNHKDSGINVWKDNIIEHNVRLDKSPFFKITKENGVYDIEILRTDNHFLNYLINTSRVHWKIFGEDPFKAMENEISPFDNPDYHKQMFEINEKREAYRAANRFVIDEKGLLPEQIAEQKLHLINKLFAFGFLLHKEKVADRAWTPFAMDATSESATSANGGTGKSVFFNSAMRVMLKSNSTKSGRDKELFNNKHVFDGVTKDTDYLLFDDLDKGFPYDRIYTEVTGSMNVNPKNAKAYSIDFKDSPKIALTSNFAVDDADSSTQRRILYTVFSDWYHHKTNSLSYVHTPKDDFGKLLFDGFTEEEYNDFFNLCAQTLSWYLTTTEKIDCPMGAVDGRNKRQAIGDDIYGFFDTFFEDKKDLYVLRSALQAELAGELPKIAANLSAIDLKKKLIAWAEVNKFKFNPYPLLTKPFEKGLIRKSYKGKTVEWFYVQSKGQLPATKNLSPSIQWTGSSNGITDNLSY
jgi:hypothetical protein